MMETSNIMKFKLQKSKCTQINRDQKKKQDER